MTEPLPASGLSHAIDSGRDQATFVIISQSGGRITPVVMTVAIPAQVCCHNNFYETGHC